jgi:hypothetical protein
VLTFGRPPVTGSVAENRAAPDSLAYTADPTQAQNGKAGPATAKMPVAGPAPWHCDAQHGPIPGCAAMRIVGMGHTGLGPPIIDFGVREERRSMDQVQAAAVGARRGCASGSTRRLARSRPRMRSRTVVR